MKSGKSQDLLSKSASIANSLVLIWRSVGSSSRKGHCFNLKAVRQGESPLTCKKVRLLSYLEVCLIWWGPPTLEREMWFTQSTDLAANLIQKHLYRNAQNNIWANIWVSLGPVKLIHRINQYIHPISCKLYISCSMNTCTVAFHRTESGEWVVSAKLKAKLIKINLYQN